MTIAPLYLGLHGLVLVALSLRVVRLRREFSIPLGSGKEILLERAVRAQANFSEYAALSLLLLGALELQHYPAQLLHALGFALFIARCAHAYGISFIDEDYRFRTFATTVTFTVIAVASLFLVSNFFRPL
jgi:uncharacterized protein